MWYLFNTPKFFQWMYPKRIWAFSSQTQPQLTFDDGPIPEVTPWVLDQLKNYNIKATFFCIGDNIKKHPKIFKRIIAEGHQVGNHTFNHINGWKTNTNQYLDNVKKTEVIIQSYFENKAEKLFRPPYGKLTTSQAKKLRNEGYKIMMWSLLSGDFDHSITKEQCLKNCLDNLKMGSIVVMHDSIKAEKNLRYVLPKVLFQLSGQKSQRDIDL